MPMPETFMCRGCGHNYLQPCHGQNKDCMNFIWAKQHGTVPDAKGRRKAPKLPPQKKPVTIDVHVMDTVTDHPCGKCGCTGWIIDSDGEGHSWLLCLAANGKPDCIQTRDLPANMRVVE